MPLSSISNRGRSPTKYCTSTNSDPIDEDEQRELVESLRRDAAVQEMQLFKVYGFGIGGMAIVFSLIFPLLCPDECSTGAAGCWSHAVYSSLTHLYVIHPFVLKNTSTRVLATRMDAVAFLLQAIPIIFWFAGFFSRGEDNFHLILLIGNAISYLGAHLVCWDMQSTLKSIEELDAARYKHKTL